MCMIVRGVGLLRGSGGSGLFLIRHIPVLLGISLSNRIRSGPSFLRVATSAKGSSSQPTCTTSQRNDPFKQPSHLRSPIDDVKKGPR